MNSLRNRLLLAMLAVAGITLALAALISTRVVTTEVREFAHAPISEVAPEDFRAAARTVEEFYARTNRWDGITATLEQISAKTKRSALVIDAAGKLIAIAPEPIDRSRVEFGADDTLTLEITSPSGVQRAQFVDPHISCCTIRAARKSERCVCCRNRRRSPVALKLLRRGLLLRAQSCGG